jgi:hypothetical protein
LKCKLCSSPTTQTQFSMTKIKQYSDWSPSVTIIEPNNSGNDDNNDDEENQFERCSAAFQK